MRAKWISKTAAYRRAMRGGLKRSSSRPPAKGLLTGLMLLWLGMAVAAPPIQHWITDNGARVLFIQTRQLPMFDARVVFDAGSARDGDAHGLAALTNALLVEGGGDWDADAIAERLDSVGARLSHGVDRDMVWLAIRALSEPAARDVAVSTLGALITAPRFEDSAFARVRERMVIAARQARQSADEVARRALYRAIYGSHPYAQDPAGEAETLKALDVARARAFHQRYYNGANALVVLVGDLDRARAETIATRLVGALPRGDAAPPPPRVARRAAEPGLRHIDFPASQTHLLLGQPGMKRGDKDYFPLYVGNHILGGGGLVSRLSREVREKRGLAYGAYSYFAPLREAGPFVVGASTKNSQAVQALEVMRETLKRFVAKGPDEAELQAAKQNLIGGFPRKIASNRKLSQYLATIGFYRYPLDYLERFPAIIDAVTREQIHDAFRRRIDPAHMATIEVGGAAGDGETR